MTDMTHDELRGLPPVVDIATAGRVLGLGRDRAYEEAKRPGSPIYEAIVSLGPVRKKVCTGPLLASIGINYAATGPLLPEPRPGRSWRVDSTARAAQ